MQFLVTSCKCEVSAQESSSRSFVLRACEGTERFFQSLLSRSQVTPGRLAAPRELSVADVEQELSQPGTFPAYVTLSTKQMILLLWQERI